MKWWPKKRHAYHLATDSDFNAMLMDAARRARMSYSAEQMLALLLTEPNPNEVIYLVDPTNGEVIMEKRGRNDD